MTSNGKKCILSALASVEAEVNTHAQGQDREHLASLLAQFRMHVRAIEAMTAHFPEYRGARQ